MRKYERRGTMSEELRKKIQKTLPHIICSTCGGYAPTQDRAEEFIEIFLEWHIRERKKWAISRKPKEKQADTPIKQEYCDQYNQALADYVQNLEEG
jgi:hypothetical protein